MSGNHTPTEEVIRHAVTFQRERLGEPRPISGQAFDRFLARVKAEAATAALREAARSGLVDAASSLFLHDRADHIENRSAS